MVWLPLAVAVKVPVQVLNALPAPELVKAWLEMEANLLDAVPWYM